MLRRLLRDPWTPRRFNQSILKEISPSKDWCWSWDSNTLVTWCKGLTHWKRPWSWERLKSGGEGDDRGWDGWMASLSRWTWVWESSGSWWWTGKPGVLQSMGLQRVRHDCVTELTNLLNNLLSSVFRRPSVFCFHYHFLSSSPFTSFPLTHTTATDFPLLCLLLLSLRPNCCRHCC